MRPIKTIRLILVAIFITVLLNACGTTEDNTVSIAFISASYSNISIKGTGGAGLSEVSEITFQVRDPLGVVLPDQSVEFSLSTQVGGISLTPTSVISDDNGMVSTIVQSGSIPTPVRVIASIPGTDIQSQSDLLTITSGIPDQDSMSIAADLHNPEGYDYNGVEVAIIASVGDIFNNVVPIGTSISFTTEGGVIEGSCLTDETSGCTVIWRSQNPRPADGIVTIMATALGQESFVDVNGDGLFDAGDSFTDLAEAFRDDNDNGVYDSGEFFEDLNQDGVYTLGDNLYNGSSCMPGYQLCSSYTHVHARTSIRLVMSTSAGNIFLNPAGPVSAPTTVQVTIQDLNGNSMPGGSAIDVTSDNGVIVNQDLLPSSVPSNTITPLNFDVILASDGTPSSGNLTIKVTAPDQTITSIIVTLND